MLTEIRSGKKAWWKGKPGTITTVVGFSQVGFLADGAGEPVSVPVSELEGEKPAIPAPPAVAALKPWQLQVAQQRFDVLKPFLKSGQYGNEMRAAIKAAPPSARLSAATAYRLIHNWRAYPELSSLAPRIPSGGKNKSRLGSEQVEKAMSDCILNKYAVRSEPTARHVYEQNLPEFCRAYDCEVPSYDVFTRRIRRMRADIIAKGRKGSKYVRRHFGQYMGSNPLSTGPLHCVQMDFWEAHVLLVDSATRQPIGRPYLALASCTTTRMPYGYYLSFDPPSASTAALAIMRGALPKDEILKRLKIDGEWPVWGFPSILHLDNALEFRGTVLENLAIRDNKFEIIHRPVREPHFGGSIESRFKMLATKLYHIPGSTGFNPMNRPHAKAVEPTYTIEEFEEIIVTILLAHALTASPSLGDRSPMDVWKSYFFDRNGQQINELKQIPVNPERLLVECLPFKDVALGRDGVVWDYMMYDNAELSSLKKELDITKNSVKLEVRRDPRDITTIYMLNPITGNYSKLQCAERHSEAIPLWKWRQSKEKVPKGERSEETINRYRIRLNEIQANAIDATKSARKGKERLKHGLKMKSADEDLVRVVSGKPSSDPLAVDDSPGDETTKTPEKPALPPASQRFKKRTVLF